MKLAVLVALPFLAWCADFDIELNGTTEAASSLEPLTTTTELYDTPTERDAPHIHARVIPSRYEPFTTTELHYNPTERDAPHIHARLSSGLTEKFTRYGFYRLMGPHGGGGTRRVFGGVKADLKDYPATCVLVDRYYNPRCSAAVVAPRWAVTAAHCISTRVAYVKYNTRRPSSQEGNIARVMYLYRHPQYQVEEKDEGYGMDVVLLHHDVGLVRVQGDMVLRTNLPSDPLVAMRRYSPAEMNREELQVMGYGRTEEQHMGEELVTTRLRMMHCYRSRWYHCICGIANLGRTSDTGVCSGDSGGPVLYNGVQVGVTSMGPVDCGEPNTFVPSTAVSVFTSLYNYADLINATIHDAESSVHMDKYTASEAQMSHLRYSVLGMAVLSICYL